MAYILIFFSKNVYGTIAYYLMVGLSAGGRVAIGTMYLNEFVPLKYQSLSTSLVGCGDASIMIF